MIAISSGIVVMMSVVNSFGKEVVAGFGAAQRLESLIMIPAMTLGSVVNSMAGQNIGAGPLGAGIGHRPDRHGVHPDLLVHHRSGRIPGGGSCHPLVCR